ncbi:MAG: hypothetical protein QM496_20635, partial [Verrucomicrobiota bacterium]
MRKDFFSKELPRRRFVQMAAASLPLVVGGFGACQAKGNGEKKIKVAVVMTTFFYRSHAHVILENFLQPYLFNGKVVDPREEFEIASFYVDQLAEEEGLDGESSDMSQEVAKEFGIPVFENIAGALGLGGEGLAVDAVLIIGEHGKYPFNGRGQELYPKKRFFDETVAVFKKSGRVVPVYSDKHLSHLWDEAKAMYDTSRSMGFGLMAGSSVPLAERRPVMKIPSGAKVVEAVSIHGGPVERYDFHGFEVLQSLLEGRAGNESGVSEVQFLQGDALWKAADEGRWSADLAAAAMRAEFPDDKRSLKEMWLDKFADADFYAVLVNYKDGTRGTVLKVGNDGIRWNFACQLEGESKPLSTRFHVGPWNNRNLFRALSHSIQEHFRQGRSPYPVERTLLTTGLLEAEMESRDKGGVAVKTPQ